MSSTECKPLLEPGRTVNTSKIKSWDEQSLEERGNFFYFFSLLFELLICLELFFFVFCFFVKNVPCFII